MENLAVGLAILSFCYLIGAFAYVAGMKRGQEIQNIVTKAWEKSYNSLKSDYEKFTNKIY